MTHRDISYSSSIFAILLGTLLSVTLASTAAVADDAAPPADQKQTLKELLIQKGVITKEDAATLQETVLAKWIDRLTFYGDLRIRDEQFFDDNNANGANNGGVDQNRQRFRVRLGTTLKMSDVTAGVRLDSGTGQATGTNQTESALFTQKGIWLDLAYLSWQGSSTKWLKLTAGKMVNPFLVLYSGDVVWDADITPEGFAENVKGSPAEHVTLFLNAGQFSLSDLGTDNHDQWLFGEQVGVSVEPQSSLKATLAVADYDFVNVDHPNAGVSATTSCGLGQNPIQQGNTRVACPVGLPGSTYLLNRYNVLDATALVEVKAGPIPVALMGDYVRNLADTNTAGGVATGNEGYQIGAIVGKAAEAHTWEVAYFYKVVQTDATVADISDSDFGSGGTARRGHIVWGAYNLTKYFQMKVKYFMTKSTGPLATAQTGCSAGTGCGDINRLQADLEVKF